MLDEATVALDNRTEIQLSLANLCKDGNADADGDGDGDGDGEGRRRWQWQWQWGWGDSV
jgi:hypothetical protein